jgi:hypothetical protein
MSKYIILEGQSILGIIQFGMLFLTLPYAIFSLSIFFFSREMFDISVNTYQEIIFIYLIVSLLANKLFVK